MLYLVCGGTSMPCRERRWKKLDHRISPQTRAPTANAAIHEPCHRCRMVGASAVAGSGKPSRLKVLFAQPEAPTRTAPASVAPAIRRPFLDAASGEPMDQVAREAYLAALDDGWADADRLYREGRRARLLLDAAREAVAQVLGARPDETA